MLMSLSVKLKSKRKILIPLVVIAIAALWYAFRPELLFINRTVAEALPTTADKTPPAKIANGTFHSVSHETTGDATVYKSPDGKQFLRLTNFHTSNGPDVVVYLVAAADAADSATVKNADVIDLGSMKGNVGDQNYELPLNVDLNKYRAVTIWCRRFSVNFATAPLRQST
jgi:hypothetical protein